MIRSLLLLCLITGTFSFSVIVHQFHPWIHDQWGQCVSGAIWSECEGLCLRTCENPNPAECPKEFCVPGCICPAGTFRNHNYLCMSKEHC